MSPRVFILFILRILVKVSIIGFAILLHANMFALIIILFIIFFSELYKNVATALILRGIVSNRFIGVLVSILDGVLLTFALYVANALNTDLYLFILFSIAINTSEYGLLSAIAEGIVAGFSYAIFVLSSLGVFDPYTIFTTYLLRVSFLVFLGWLTGWLATELNDKETKLQLVLEDDVHEERLNEMKNTFVNDAAENIKTPLSAIKGYLDLLLNGRAGDLDPSVQEYLQNIYINADKVGTFADELLHIIQMDEDAMRLKKKPKSVNSFIEDVKSDSLAFSKIYRSKLTFHEDVHIDRTITIDEYRLTLAVRNVLSYLFDLSGKEISLLFKSDDEFLYLTMDTDCNEMENLEIFSNEEEIDKSKVQEHSLLKVYTSKLIIESHNGSITIGKKGENSISVTVKIPFTLDATHG